MKITLTRMVDSDTPQGYWSIIELRETEEQFTNHPYFGRVRIVSCEQTETRCGFGAGCFAVTETTVQQEPLLVRALKLKRAGWRVI